MTASFDDLVTAATVGVSRKPLAITDLAGPAAAHRDVLDAAHPAAALLDAAALMTVAQRAGFRPAHGMAGPPPSPEDAAPELSARAERALRQLGGAQLAPGFAAGDKELLADLLNAASDAGYAASAPLLPDLLDAAVRTVALRPAVIAVLGVRGRWLAAHRTDWQRVVEAVPPLDAPAADPAAVAAATAGAAPPTPSADPEAWRTGGRGERRAYLAAQRERDPAAGRELLAADWPRLAADERAALLAVLARGLSADDEEFLDAALDDRAGAVRTVAQRLLTLAGAVVWLVVFVLLGVTELLGLVWLGDGAAPGDQGLATFSVVAVALALVALIMAPALYLFVPLLMPLDVIPEGLKQAVAPKLATREGRGFVKLLLSELEGAADRAAGKAMEQAGKTASPDEDAQPGDA